MEAASPKNEARQQDAASPPAWRGFSDASLRYVEARGKLLQIEAKESAQDLVVVLIRGVLACILALAGWFLTVPALLWLLSHSQGWPVPRTFIFAGLAHLLLALITLRTIKSRLSHATWFSDTLDQFKKDRAWISSQTKKP